MAISVCDVHTNQLQKDTSAYGSAEFPVACYEDDMSRISVPVHWHDEFEFIAATEGLVTVLVNGESVALKAGESIFINSGCLHGVQSVTGAVSMLRSLVILPKLIGGSSDSVIFRKTVLPFHIHTAPVCVVMREHTDWQDEIREHMLKAWTEITGEPYDFENGARYSISKAMRILADHLPDAAGSRTANTSIVDRVKRSITYMEEHCRDDIANRDLTGLLGCSESVLLRSFRQVTGTTPMQFLLRYRIQKAAELLLTTDLKSNAIAISCGFHDLSYFTRVFRHHMGVTPARYRDTNAK